MKRREFMATSWRWEIWAAGKSKPVQRSEEHYSTMSAAMKKGKAALKALVQKKFPDAA
jgi:hypothetical protein